MSQDKGKSSDVEMTFFEHIDALRPHLVRGFLALIVVMVGAFLAKKYIIDMVLMGPKSPDFPTNRMMCYLSKVLTGGDTMCINNIEFNMINTALGGQFNLHMQISMVTALVIAIPYLLWELWRFIAPALTTRERGKSRTFVFYVSVCFLTGVLFGYYLIVPLSINFLYGYTASVDIVNMIDVKSYLSTVLHVSLACGIVFLLPMFIYFLTRMGLVTADFLKRYRRHALVLLAVLSAIITPPDLFSLILVIIPLYMLYELSIYIAGRTQRRMAALEEEEEAAYRAGLVGISDDDEFAETDEMLEEDEDDLDEIEEDEEWEEEEEASDEEDVEPDAALQRPDYMEDDFSRANND